MTNKTLTKDDLRQFTGSEPWYRHGINRRVVFTDGAKYVADTGGAYWLLDEIALIQPYDKAIAAEEFPVWGLKVGNDRTVFTKAIEYTDFPLPEITLYFQNNTIFLPSEY